MSIQSEISRITENIASAYTALSVKGATMPSVLNTANLKSTIESIEMMTAEAMSVETIRRICYVPSDFEKNYTAVEYIQSTGTQYIDTGFMPNQDTKVVMDVQSVGVNESVTGQALFGARNGTAYRYFLFWHRTKAEYYFQYNNASTVVDSERLTERMVVTMDRNNLTMGDAFSVSTTYAAFECAQNLYLFAINLDGTADYFGVNRVYSCQIYDNGTLVRDFVPCYRKSDGAVGLYDMVGKKFYANAGSGVFFAPTEIVELPDGYTQVEYIQSSGTQLINSGFVVNTSDIRLVGTFEPTELSSTPNPLFGCYYSGSSGPFFSVEFRDGSFFSARGTGVGSALKSASLNTRYLVDFSLSGGKFSLKVDGAEIMSSAYSGSVNTRNPYGIMGVYYESLAALYPARMKCYGLQHYSGGNLIRYYVPCINPSGSYGLYDIVNAQFYANAGSGNFTGA